jgi:hypothetical protein
MLFKINGGMELTAAATNKTYTNVTHLPPAEAVEMLLNEIHHGKKDKKRTYDSDTDGHSLTHLPFR